MAFPPLPDIDARRRANAFANLDLRNRLLAAERMEPKDWQEAHAETEAYLVRHDAYTDVELTRRRKVDGRFWEAMGPDRVQAALDIRDAFEIVTGGRLGRVTSRYGDASGGGLREETKAETAGTDAATFAPSVRRRSLQQLATLRSSDRTIFLRASERGSPNSKYACPLAFFRTIRLMRSISGFHSVRVSPPTVL